MECESVGAEESGIIRRCAAAPLRRCAAAPGCRCAGVPGVSGVLRRVAETACGDADWIIHLLCRVFVEAGREGEARAYVDDYFARHDGHPDEHAWARTHLRELCGRTEEADAGPSPQTPAEELLPFGTTGGVIAQAERLVRQGEPEKAIAHLRDRLDGTRRSRVEDL
ncbi:hypothetical protein OG784_06460 [Streptomyces sp. NBC_01617]|uniref:hypothetical protein n=1 Tax=Streptomyces sp. NBC_01617 TaxID=2975899 RepID=UPI00386F4677|nr:hypothetical protein OG784_06460 [Streptomyces sp. NBC_01617]